VVEASCCEVSGIPAVLEGVCGALGVINSRPAGEFFVVEPPRLSVSAGGESSARPIAAIRESTSIDRFGEPVHLSEQNIG
jgi:hypothetical protein